MLSKTIIIDPANTALVVLYILSSDIQILQIGYAYVLECISQICTEALLALLKCFCNCIYKGDFNVMLTIV